MDYMHKKESSAKRDGSSFFIDAVPQCKNKALVYLGMREHNRNELALKLKQKGFSSNIIEEALDLLEDEGSLSEKRYVQSFVRSSNKRHPEGKTIVLQRLLAKGANRNISIQVLDEIYDQDYTNDLKEKALAKLQDKGHSEEEIRFLLRKLGF